jgi:hypothetical protein
MRQIGADIFTQEYKTVYGLYTPKKKLASHASTVAPSSCKSYVYWSS